MRSNILKFAQQGLWPALSGGWYYDPNHSNFTNIFHMYTWIFLLCLPFALYQSVNITWVVTLIYTLVLALFIAVIKFVSFYLHKTFDFGEQMQKKVSQDGNTDEVNNDALDENHENNLERGAGDNVHVGPRSSNDESENAGHLQLWAEISKNAEFGDISLDALGPGTTKTHADVHNDNFPEVIEPTTSGEPSTSKRKRIRKKKTRHYNLGQCDSIPNANCSDSDTPKKLDLEMSSPSASEDENEEKEISSNLSFKRKQGTMDKQFRIQRKAGFRNRQRPKIFSSSDTKDEEVGAGDNLPLRRDSRKRNAPPGSNQGPQHKRCYSCADVDGRQKTQEEHSQLSSIEQTKMELKKLKSNSLPSSSPSDEQNANLTTNDDDAVEDKPSKGNSPPDKASENSLTSLSSTTSSSDFLFSQTFVESPESKTKFIPSTVVLKKEKRKNEKLSINKSASTSEPKVGASLSCTLPIAAHHSNANKITLEEFLTESAVSLKTPRAESSLYGQCYLGNDLDRYKPAKYFDSLSSDGEDQQKYLWKTGADAPHFPLLSGAGESSSANQNTKPRKVTYNFSHLQNKDTSSSPSDDSEAQSVEENFQKCLQNFNKIPGVQRPKTYSRRTMSASSAVWTRRATPSGQRQRHPAGEEVAEHSNKDSSALDDEEANPSEVTNANKLHFAKGHTDTTEGAVHRFQDEHGRWMEYTFSTDGPGVAYDVALTENRQGSVLRSRSTSSRTRGDSSSSTSNREQRELERTTSERIFSLPSRRILRFPEQQGILDTLRSSIENGQRMAPPGPDGSPPSVTTPIELFAPETRAPSPKVKTFYKVKLFGSRTITIQYDRLALLDLLDRNVLWLEVLLSILFMVLVALLGLQVLSQNLLFDIWSFWFCVVIATSQFPLVRSVQPDSASPTHGHNRVIAYSRPFYFTICASLLILFTYLSDESNVRLPGVPIYGITLFDNKGCSIGRDFMLAFTLLLPVVFVFGLLPQVNTFVMYLCEQTEVHAFGGTGSSGILSSVFSVARSLLAIMFLYGLCYGAMLSKEGSQNIIFSAFCGLLVSLSYHLSRQTSSPLVTWKIIKEKIFGSTVCNKSHEREERGNDPAKEADSVGEKHEMLAVSERLQSDVVLCPIIAILMFAIHCSTAFFALQPAFSTVLYILVGCFGLFNHYLLPQLRKNLPWLFIDRPILKSHEYDLFEVTEEAVLMWYEKIFVWICFCEKNLLFPLLIVNQLSVESSYIVSTYGLGLGTLILVVIGMKLLRSSFSVPAIQYLVASFTILFVKYDAQLYAPSILISYYFFSILFVKIQDLVLKLHFWLVYVAPWQITWGSAFHAFTQPFAVPHSAFLTAHALLASLLQAPFVPFLGSALFLSSYPRPLKFWERNYKTKRIDHSNTRLSAQLDRGPHSDDNNLNSIFYEHLTYSLQKSLAGDVELGRWGSVSSGDCFIMTSDNLNALVHVVELGNGILTFQLRGLEFSGTYCHQREVEAINECPTDNTSCCCCRPGRVKGFLSFNSAFNQRWLAWEVIVSNYVLDGYSISDNNATTMLGVFDLRKILLSYIVKSIIFFFTSHESLPTWLEDSNIREMIEVCEKPNYADVDSAFAVAIDDDYDVWLYGVSLVRFGEVYGPWIEHCAQRRRDKDPDLTLESGKDSKLVTLCFALSVLGRRALGTATHSFSSNLDAFLYGLHALFKGDFRITASKDEWVFSDMNLLREVVAPGVRTAVKLHQQHFQCPDEYDQPEALYDAITDFTQNMVIAHEGDPVWRKAVLSNTKSLLALRRVVSDSLVDQYSVITLNHRPLGFNIVKANRESVRGLWAGQQNELVFLRNRNPERGSIQNAKQVLRNMINSSCDQPIGYPIYVSPLTSSYASTNQQLTRLTGGPITFESVRNCCRRFVACLRQSCSGSCNSGGSAGLPVQQSVPLQSFSRGSTRPAAASTPALQAGIFPPRPHNPPSPPQSDLPVFATTNFGLTPTGDRLHRRAISSVDVVTRRNSGFNFRKRSSLAQDSLPDLNLGKITFHSSASITGSSKKLESSFKRNRDSTDQPQASKVANSLSSRPSASGSDVSDKREIPHTETVRL